MRLITKSLFVEYNTFPKLAWWRWNDLGVYRKVKKIETDEAAEQIMDLGKTVEQLVGDHLTISGRGTISDMFPDIPETDEERLDDDDTWIGTSFFERIERNISETEKAIHRGDTVIYQPGFRIGDCYVRADYLVRNFAGSYDLYEVKAKSHVRKPVMNNGVKEHIGAIDDEFKNDVSFQKFVIDAVMESWGLPGIAKTYLAHLNPAYVRNGPIDKLRIISIDEAGSFSQIPVIQGAEGKQKEKLLDRDDTLMPISIVRDRIDRIRSECILSQEEFNRIHPFPGNKYLEYFGQEKSFGSIYCIPIHHSRAPLIARVHSDGRHDIADLAEEELCDIGENASCFIDRYWQAENCAFIDKVSIKTRLDGLRFPICFYDYESVSVPVPILDGTSPYQQAVVQYSLHKLYEDGSMEHFGALISEESDEKSVIEIPELFESDGPATQVNRRIVGSQTDLFDAFIKDIGSDLDHSSFVVWFHPFENSRNKEIAKSYPQFANAFLKINDSTFDLYEIFSDYLCFDRAFKGSASIKKVLPVLVPELSYDLLEIGKGDVAMRALRDLIEKRQKNVEERLAIIKNLLKYCRQDSFAMLAIYKKLFAMIG